MATNAAGLAAIAYNSFAAPEAASMTLSGSLSIASAFSSICASVLESTNPKLAAYPAIDLKAPLSITSCIFPFKSILAIILPIYSLAMFYTYFITVSNPSVAISLN